MFTLPMLEGLFLLFNQRFENISLLDFAGVHPFKSMIFLGNKPILLL
jgi:hypothetical protein